MVSTTPNRPMRPLTFLEPTQRRMSGRSRSSFQELPSDPRSRASGRGSARRSKLKSRQRLRPRCGLRHNTQRRRRWQQFWARLERIGKPDSCFFIGGFAQSVWSVPRTTPRQCKLSSLTPPAKIAHTTMMCCKLPFGSMLLIIHLRMQMSVLHHSVLVKERWGQIANRQGSRKRKKVFRVVGKHQCEKNSTLRSPIVYQAIRVVTGYLTGHHIHGSQGRPKQR